MLTRVRTSPDPALVSLAVALASNDVILDSVQGTGSPLGDWLTSYPMLLVSLDPYTAESSWILDTACRFLDHFAPADIRVGWLVAADDAGCRSFLGPLAEQYLTFADPERLAINNFGIERLPALVHVRSDLHLQVSNGWDPAGWRAIAADLAPMLHWSRPTVPQSGDPVPYLGTPAAG